MFNQIFQRTWVSPIVAISFAVVAATGTMMFFGIRLPAFHSLHEVLGLVFTAAGAIHLILNWRAFMALLRRRLAVVSLVGAVFLTLAFAVWGGEEGEGHGRGAGHGPRAGAPSAEQVDSMVN